MSDSIREERLDVPETVSSSKGGENLINQLPSENARLREHPDLRLGIEGHTDAVGSAEANQSLSERRAAGGASASRGLPRTHAYGPTTS